MKIGKREFVGGTYIMAVINVTPDSFWKGSRCTEDEIADRVKRAVEDGADVIDIGAQSTRPGYTEVPPEEEIRRLDGCVRKIKEITDIPLSVDTYSAVCARHVLSLGADMINDVWGLTRERDMAQTIAEYGASVCIMHNAVKPLEGDIWPQIRAFLERSIETALSAGIERDKICLDGGVGFAKNREQNIELVRGYPALRDLGYPLLIGVSRKSMFGGNVEDRLAPTVRVTEMAAREKITFVRVHDVKENAEAVRRVLYGENNH